MLWSSDAKSNKNRFSVTGSITILVVRTFSTKHSRCVISWLLFRFFQPWQNVAALQSERSPITSGERVYFSSYITTYIVIGHSFCVSTSISRTLSPHNNTSPTQRFTVPGNKLRRSVAIFHTDNDTSIRHHLSWLSLVRPYGPTFTNMV